MSAELQLAHINKYKHNKAFISFGITSVNGDYSDWWVTGSFYAAVHLVEAVFAKENLMPTNESKDGHRGRKDCMFNNPSLFPSDVRATYKTLQSLSEKARYHTAIITPKEALTAQESLEMLESTYQRYIT